MSDSILYLAIVAIWAGFLIPAWVRRPHASKAEFDAEAYEFAGEAGVAQVAVQMTAVDFEAAPVDLEAAAAVGFEAAAVGYEAVEFGFEAVAGRPAPGPSQSRQQMMRARRRILTILASLVFITAGFVATGFVKWWICVPPVGLLVLYVLLLREIAMADAESARKRAAWEASAARDVWRRAHRAWEAEREREAAAQPTAQVIDISRRVGDQLYDQYADAAARAVGD